MKVRLRQYIVVGNACVYVEFFLFTRMAFFLCIKRSKMKSNPIYTFFDYVSYDFSMYVIFLLCIFYHVCGKYHVLKLVVSPFLCSVYFRMSRVRVFVSLDFCFMVENVHVFLYESVFFFFCLLSFHRKQAAKNINVVSPISWVKSTTKNVQKKNVFFHFYLTLTTNINGFRFIKLSDSRKTLKLGIDKNLVCVSMMANESFLFPKIHN